MIVVLLSGGLDSTVLAASYRAHGSKVLGLGIDYGQRHRVELDAAARVAQRLGIPYERVDLSPLRSVLARGSQTADHPVPHGHYAEESMKVTVVPNRNMVMLAIAAGYALSRGGQQIAIAAHSGDHAIYPDCRQGFMDAMRASLASCDYLPVSLLTPFSHMTKADIVRVGRGVDAPFDLTYSCYEGGDKHCGKCGTCVERREAFELADVPDPTVYA